MTMRSRSTVLAFCLRGCVCAGAAWMLMVGPNVAWAQQLVRLNSGEVIVLERGCQARRLPRYRWKPAVEQSEAFAARVRTAKRNRRA